eukprot:TRINITY_DN19146_c0_g1_i1.p1 TRINITY_DN19146_c0_g1~~TRINITY_DN19146_c0_g1_i1.p1  ORF type:complete len:540 (+),score=64.94 TRINITY_DN19146_c0_g1_i1:142-1761(+)
MADENAPLFRAQVQSHFITFLQNLLKALGRWAYMDWQKTFSSLISFILTVFGPFLELAGVWLTNLLNNNFNGKYVTVGETTGPDGKTIRPGEKIPCSVVGQLDRRVDLEKNTKQRFPLLSAMARANADVCTIAAKLAYEAPPLVQDVINNLWNEDNDLGKFRLAGYYVEKSNNARVVPWVPRIKSSRHYAARSDTNSYVITREHSADQARCAGDVAAVVVAFRGTEPFSPVDWITDFSFQWVELDSIGRVHMGFLRALGFGKDPGAKSVDTFNRYIAAAAAVHGMGDLGHSGDTEGAANGCQSMQSAMEELKDQLVIYTEGGEIDEEATPLYFVLREKVLEILESNSDIKLFVTGHSLGGALAALFTSLLVVDSPVALKKLKGLITFGQPRVGDLTFTWYLHHRLCEPELRYIRILHCNDIVARVPFDDDVFQFKHLGPWFRSSPVCRLEMGAFNDQPKLGFLSAFFAGLMQCVYALVRSFAVEEFKETWVCLIVRFAGIFLPWLADHNPTNYINSVRLGLPLDEGRGSPGEPNAEPVR